LFLCGRWKSSFGDAHRENLTDNPKKQTTGMKRLTTTNFSGTWNLESELMSKMGNWGYSTGFIAG